MEEILHTFGIDWRLIVIQIFNFALLLGLLSYFLYKPLLKVIDERKAKIAQGVKDAEKAAETLAHASEEGKAQVTLAHQEAESIVARAKDAASKEGAGIIASAHEQSERIAKEAQAKAEAEAAALIKESEKEVAQVAILAAEKILKERG